MADNVTQKRMQTILVIDDDPKSLGMIVNFLEEHDCRVVVSRDGESGIERARYVRPALILLDIMMPGIDGFETCRQLKKDPVTFAIPVIFLTSLHYENDIVTAFEAGGVDYITKPLKLEELWARVSNHLKIQEMQAQLMKQNERLMELDGLKSMFIASMSHELRTPLNSILGFTSIVLDGLSGEINDKQEDHLNRVYRASKHLLSLVTDILDISKIESNTVQANVNNFMLHECIAEAIESVQGEIQKKELVLTVNVPEYLQMQTDKKRLLQCIMNLMNNAVKFSDHGTITLTAEQQDDKIVISVSDQGIGITQEDMARLFQPFQRMDSHLSIKAGGTGLGLYLTRKLVEEVLSGTVEAHSEKGCGSTFCLRLPRSIKESNP